MDTTPKPRRGAPRVTALRDHRATWKGYLDRGAVAAAFLMILWFLTAGLRPGAETSYETAAVKPSPAVSATPISAKAP
jgi:hypothetical protein